METRYTGTASLPVLAATAMLLTACASTTPDGGVPLPPIEPVQDTSEKLASARKEIADLVQERNRLKKNLKKSRERNRELKLELLDKAALVHQLEAEKERAIEAVVQAKARLRSRQSKAEAVANLAEMKLALQQAAKEGSGPDGGLILSQARELLDMAEQALNEENLEGASYLMSQARELIGSARNRGTSVTGHREGEILFPVAFGLTVRQKGNVRLEPSLESEVLFQLDAGDDVLVLGRRGSWLHVRTPDNRTGWMHFNLLDDPS